MAVKTGFVLPHTGTVSYNGVEFTEMVDTSLVATPVYNNAGVQVKYVKYELTVDTIIRIPQEPSHPLYTGRSTDDEMNIIRKRLLETGQRLEYTDKGVGPVIVDNTSANKNQHDVAFGPKPTMLRMEPIGKAKAVRVQWKVEFNLPECLTGIGPTPFLQWISELSLTWDNGGFMKLTKTVTVELPKNLANKTNVEKWLDYLMEFATTWDSTSSFTYTRTFNFSPDLRTMTVTTVGTPKKNINNLPPDVENISVSHTTTSDLMSEDSMQAGFLAWMNTMSCNIKLAYDVPHTKAWMIFTAIANQRINYELIQKNKRKRRGEEVEVNKVPIILSITITESLFSNEIDMEVVWVSYMDSPNDLWKKTGMLMPLPKQFDVDEYNKDRKKRVLHTGTIEGPPERSGMTFADLPPQNRLGPCASYSSLDDVSLNDSRARRQYPTAVFQPNCPDENADASLGVLKYENSYELISTTGVVRYRTYMDPDNIERTSPTDPEDPNEREVKTYGYNDRISESDILELDFGNDVHKLNVQGHALVLGRPLAPPKQTTIKGRRLELDDSESRVRNKVLSAWGACPVYLVMWDLNYDILGKVTDVDLYTDINGTGDPGYF